MGKCVVLAGAVACLLSVAAPSPAQDAPNIVHIFVDDMGWGALSMNDAYGHTSPLLTPVLDQLAAAGMRFTQAYSAGICSPSRGQIMTGQHGGHAFNDRNVKGFIDQDITVADVLNDAGYSTAVIGKWGFGGGAGTATQNLGGGAWTAEERLNDLRINPTISGSSSANLPTNQGFDHFYGYLSHTHAHSYLVDSLYKTDANGNYELTLTGNGLRDNNGNLLDANGNIVQFNGNTPLTSPVNTKTAYTDVLFNEEAKSYISANANQNDPFYLQLNYNIPHTRYPAIEFVDGWDTPYQDHPDWDSWTDAQKQYVAMVTLMDKHVGEVLATLEDPDGNPLTDDSVMDNTMIVFVSDNGSDAHPADGQDQSLGALASNGALLGGKRDLYEGGIRVPMIVRWDGQIEAGSATDTITDFADWLPTAAALAGVEAPVGVDGVSILPTLTGEGIQRVRPWFVWENHEGNPGYATTERFGSSYQDIWAITMDGIKVIKTVHDSNGTTFYEIFDIANDPTESTPLAFNQNTIDTFQAIADAEQLEQANGYYSYRRSWTGNGGDLLNTSSWSTSGTPDERWMADLDNTSNTAATVTLTQDAELLAIDVRGSGAKHTLRIQNGATLTGRNEIRIGNNGVIDIQNGNLETVRWVDVLAGGQLTGSGDITGQLYNAGEVGPGNSPGRLSISSDYIQLATGKLIIEIGGNDAADDYDQLAVDEQAILNGQLDITTINGFNPAFGSRFAVLTYGERSGSFTDITGLDLGGGRRFIADYQSTQLELVVTTEGDADADGDVDQNDLEIVLSRFGSTIAYGVAGDWDLNGSIGTTDLNIVLRNWDSETPPIIDVPEPAASTMLLIGGLIAIRRP